MSTITKRVAANASTGTGRKRLMEVAAARSGAEVGLIPVTALRGATGLILTATETAGGFNVAISTNVHLAQGEITDNETEASVCTAQIVLPANYVPGTDLTVRIPVAIVKTAAATDNGSTIDLSVYRQASGAVGSDLVSTAAQTFAAVDTWYNKEFTVAGATLAPGDVLNLVITSSVIDSEAGGGTLRLNMGAITVLGSTEG